jgi:hypothetical protein
MTGAPREAWDFPYLPIPVRYVDDDGGPCDVVVATPRSVEPVALHVALEEALDDVRIEILLSRAPIFWTRVTSTSTIPRARLAELLEERGIAVRYVASATHGSTALAPAFDANACAPRAPSPAWRVRAPRAARHPEYEGFWFLRDDGGLAVDREVCGTGAGTRLAVIDDDGAQADWLELDAEVAVGTNDPQRALFHGALMVAYAVGTRGKGARAPFVGVAPDASPRLYLVPKPGKDVISLPLAIVRAVEDGADLVLCATYVEDARTPMLDDAIELAVRLGRRGRGTPVVLPTGRQTSSPGSSLHASLTLDLGEPASDPRVSCIAASGRDGRWFLYPDKRGRLRPFSNRGPCVRWAAPGDDLAFPFDERDRLFHGESSGASAVAAGALLLVLASNPELTLDELDRLVTSTATPLDGADDGRKEPLADRVDVLPVASDRDGHCAKTGYGRIHAMRACAAARDPVAAALVDMGEDEAARGFLRARREAKALGRAYSNALGLWAARALLADAGCSQSLKTALRHLRLVASASSRAERHTRSALTRHLALFLRALMRRADSPAPLRAELEHMEGALTKSASGEGALDAETVACAVASRAWGGPRARGAQSAERPHALVQREGVVT